MGLAQRTYLRRPPGGPPPRRPDFGDLRRRAAVSSVTAWLIGLCVAAFLLQKASPWPFLLGAFRGDSAVLSGQVWRFLTFQFLHGGLLHIAVNMIGLWFFGRMVERRLGRWRFLAFYLLCGTGGALLYFALAAVNLLGGGLSTPLVGASAGLFGCIAAAMVLFPQRILNLALPPIDITVLRFGAVYLILAAYVVIFHAQTAGSNAGGEAAHLGGAAVGFLLAKNRHRLKLPVRRRRERGERGEAGEVKAPPYMKYHGWR